MKKTEKQKEYLSKLAKEAHKIKKKFIKKHGSFTPEFTFKDCYVEAKKRIATLESDVTPEPCKSSAKESDTEHIYIDMTHSKPIITKDILQDIEKIIPGIGQHVGMTVGKHYVFESLAEKTSLILVGDCGSIAMPQDLIKFDSEIRTFSSFAPGVEGYLLVGRYCQEFAELAKRYPYIHLLPYGSKATFDGPNAIQGVKSCQKV